MENLTELTIGGMRNIKDDSRVALIYMTSQIIYTSPPGLTRLDFYRLTKTREEAKCLIVALEASNIVSLQSLSLGWNPEWWQT